MSTILQLAPQNVWKHFYSLTRIPRPSGHMEKITQFLVDFGKGLGLETFVDEAGNRWESDLLDWPVSEEYWPEFRLAEQTEGEIVAIEVNEVYFNIVRTDQPQDSPQRQYMPDYNDLGWVIDLT